MAFIIDLTPEVIKKAQKDLDKLREKRIKKSLKKQATQVVKRNKFQID